MTFYWWSHWFWITVIFVIVTLLPQGIQTYPEKQEKLINCKPLQFKEEDIVETDEKLLYPQQLRQQQQQQGQPSEKQLGSLQSLQQQQQAKQQAMKFPLTVESPGYPLMPTEQPSTASTTERTIVLQRRQQQQQQHQEQQRNQLAERVTRLYQTTATMPWSTGKALRAKNSGINDGSEHIMVLTSGRRRGKDISLVKAVVPSNGALLYERKRSADNSALNAVRGRANLKAFFASGSKEQLIDVNDNSNLTNFSSDAQKTHSGTNSSKLPWKSYARLQLQTATPTSTMRSNSSTTEISSAGVATMTTTMKMTDSNAENTSSSKSSREAGSEEQFGPLVINNDSIKDGVSDETVIKTTLKSAALEAKPISSEFIATRKLASIPSILGYASKEDELRHPENEYRSRKSKVLSAEYKHINRYINYSSDTKSVLPRSASTASNDFDSDGGNISSEALAIQRATFLDAGTMSVIGLAIVGICCTVGSLGIVLYRRRYINKPQTLSEPDSSVYIDDSIIRDNSDEMYSLDNDSFLNSLEAMTIQNYWTDTVKHTKL